MLIPIASWLIASDLHAQDTLKSCHTQNTMTLRRPNHVSTWQMLEGQHCCHDSMRRLQNHLRDTFAGEFSLQLQQSWNAPRSPC